MRINVEANIKDISKKFRNTEKDLMKGIVASLNKAVDYGFTEAKRYLVGKYTLISSDVARVIRKYKANKNKLSASLIANEKRLGFSDVNKRLKSAKWKAKQTASGVGAEVKRGSKTQLKHAFVATMKSGHRGVFELQKDKGKKEYKRLINNRVYTVKAYPIKEIVGASVSWLFGQAKLMERLNSYMREKFVVTLKSILKFYDKK